MSMGKPEIDKFNGSNDFNLWRIKMKALLVHQGLVDAITRERLAMLGDVDAPRTREMLTKAHSLLLLSLGDEVLREVADEETALGVWERLETLFLKKSLANRLLLKKQLYSMHMEEGSELKKHLDEFNRLILDLRSVEVRIDEEDQAILLLSSLPKSYEGIVDTLIYGKETLDMGEVRATLSSKEIQRMASTKDGRSEMLFINERSGRSKHRSKSKGPKKWRSKSKKPQGDKRCFLCNQLGHFKKDCPQLKKGWKKQGGGNGGSSSMVAENEGESDDEVLIASTSKNEENWVMDSGCTFHMTPHREWFSNLEESSGLVMLGDGKTCKIEGVGSIRMLMHDGCIRVLNEVRYIPTLKRNLISLGTLDGKGYSLKIQGGSLKVVKGSMVFMRGTRNEAMLYILDGRAVQGEVDMASALSITPSSLWHHRLGHMSARGLEVLSKDGMLMGDKVDHVPFCEACIKGKSTRVKFNIAKHNSKGILDYVHIDLWRQIKTKSIGGV